MRKTTPVRALCLLLIAALSLSFGACKKKGSDAPLTPGLSTIEGEPVYDDGVAVRTDHYTVTPGMMAYFFYTYGVTCLASMNETVPYDKTKTLHDQMYTETLSFYDAIMNETLDRVTRMLICCEAARAEGALLTDKEKSAVDEMITGYRMTAAVNYDKTLADYLKTTYGPLMGEDDLRAVLELETLANRFSRTVSARLEAEITAGEALAYAEEHGLADPTPSRNIAYLFLPFEGGAAPEKKIAEATEAMRRAPTSDTLQGLSPLGTVGAEADMTPDNAGIAAIADWLFATGRRVGDWGRVDLSGATYILLYTGNGASFGEVSARMRLFDAAYAAWREQWVNELTFGYNYDRLDGYDAAGRK